MFRNVPYFNTSPKTSHNFHGVHYVVKLRRFSVYSIIRYLQHAFAMDNDLSAKTKWQKGVN